MAEADSDGAITWLTEEGYRYLANESDPSMPGTGEQAANPRTRRLNPWQKSLLHEQVALRRRAQRRFPEAEKWIWTDRLLSQASDWSSATFKASLFPSHAGVLDACCGAGVDLVAICKHLGSHAIAQDETRIVALDVDSNALRIAELNGELHGQHAEFVRDEFSKHAIMRSRDVVLASNPEREFWLHIDPGRRRTSVHGDSKTTVADQFSPPLEVVLDCIGEFDGAIVKVAPSTQFSPLDLETLDSQSLRMWIGNQGECKQQLLLFGNAITHANERCAHLQVTEMNRLAPRGGSLRHAVLTPSVSGLKCDGTQVFTGVPQALMATDTVGDYVYDMHSTLHASALQTSWAERYELKPLGDESGFYTGDKPLPESQWAMRFQVLDSIPWDDRRVRKLLRSLNAGWVEVKNRLVRMDANYFQRRYQGDGDRALVLLVTKLGKRVRCIVAERCRN